MKNGDALEAHLDSLASRPDLRETVDDVRHRARLLESLRGFWEAHPELREGLAVFLQLYGAIVATFEKGGRLFLCGNGGSFADALHISGELMKSYLIARRLPEADRTLLRQYGGDDLAKSLQPGFPVIVLGLNHSLLSAMENDVEVPRLGFAQELYCLGDHRDALLGISTSGNAVNVLNAVAVARALGMETLALTGRDGGRLGRVVRVAMRVPADETRRVQEMHQAVYHTLCAMLEARFFAADD